MVIIHLVESGPIVVISHNILILLVISISSLRHNLIVIQLISFLLTVSLLLSRSLPLAFERLLHFLGNQLWALDPCSWLIYLEVCA